MRSCLLSLLAAAHYWCTSPKIQEMNVPIRKRDPPGIVCLGPFAYHVTDDVRNTLICGHAAQMFRSLPHSRVFVTSSRYVICERSLLGRHVQQRGKTTRNVMNIFWTVRIFPIPELHAEVTSLLPRCGGYRETGMAMAWPWHGHGQTDRHGPAGAAPMFANIALVADARPMNDNPCHQTPVKSAVTNIH